MSNRPADDAIETAKTRGQKAMDAAGQAVKEAATVQVIPGSESHKILIRTIECEYPPPVHE